MWKLIIIAMMISGGAEGDAEIKIKTLNFTSNKTCQVAKLFFNREGNLRGNYTGKYVIVSSCVRK